MAAYEMIFSLIKEYFIELGFNPQYVDDYFSARNVSEIASIKLANANVIIKNKTDRTSHQTHIAVTGEMIDLFYDPATFKQLDTERVEYRDILISKDNLKALKNLDVYIENAFDIATVQGKVTIGKRTQKQLQLSKKNTLNSACFNELRAGLYENDLLILLKRRCDDKIMMIGIPQTVYLDIIPNYTERYGTNTYLRIPNK